MKLSRSLDNRIVVLLDQAENKTESGIHLPDTYGDKFSKGEVVCVGRGIVSNGVIVPLDIKVGERVALGKTSGVRFEDGEDEYAVLPDFEVIGVL